jgi:predicted nucleic acid-binding protein
MNEFVLDVNVIFSALISGKDLYEKIFSDYKFYVPDFALLEIDEYKNLLLKKTKLNNDRLKEFSIILFSKLILIPNFLISNQSIKQAFELCKDIDEKDTMYIALSLELDFPLLTRDKKLYTRLKDKDFKSIILFDDFLSDHLSE